MDIQLVAHAKDYIDDLAKGINPFTKEEVAESDIVNNVKISRCLFFVSDVLQEVIENGGAPAPKKREKKVPFDVESVDLSGFVFSDRNVNVSDIVKQINTAKPENMVNLKVTAITDWLVDMNVLEVVTLNGKKRKYPTAQGEALGIQKVENYGQYGVYYSVTYDSKAQHFILDNLPAIIEGGYNNSKSKEEA